MAYFADDFNRTSPAGPGDSTAGTPDYEVGANWDHWNAGGTRGVVIHNNALSQYENWSFHAAAYPTLVTDTDDQAIEFTITDADTEFRIGLRASATMIADGDTDLDDPDAHTAPGQITLRCQMDQGTPGQVTVIIDNAYQGPTNITGSTRYDDSTPHTFRAEVQGNEVRLYIDGALKFTRNDMGTLPSGSTRRRIGLCWNGAGEVQHFDNFACGDFPLSADGPAAGLTADPSELAAFFIRNQRQITLWEGSSGAATPVVEGVATASFGGTFEASGVVGTPPVQGQATADFGGTFTAAGVPRTPGVAAVTFGGTFTASGVDRALGVAVASFGFTATAAGVDRALGQAAATFGGTLTASGIPRTPGVAVAAFGFTATASGFAGAAPVQGQATADFGGTFTALGIDRTLGVAVATYGFTATASGHQPRTGTATASFGYTATASGRPRVLGAGTASFGFTATIFIITYQLRLVAVGGNRYSATTSSRYSGAAGGNRYSAED